MSQIDNNIIVLNYRLSLVSVMVLPNNTITTLPNLMFATIFSGINN